MSRDVDGGALTSIAFIGDESLLIECATTARAAGASVVAVSTRSAVVRERAEVEGFVVIGSEELQGFVDEHPVDVLFSIANEYVVSDDIIAKVGLAVNFHDGPLPDYKGLAVTTWALFHGEPQHAVTWHTMTTEVDAGEIVLAETFDLAPDETAFSLNARCYETALRTFPDVLQAAMSEQPTLTAQADRPGTWFGRYQRPVVLLDPSAPAVEIDRAVRSLALGPRIRNRLGAVRWVLGDQALLVAATELVPASGRPIGTVAVEDGGVQLATSDGDVLITELTTLDGDDLQPATLEALAGLAPPTDGALLERLTGADEHLARHETFWLERLGRFNDAQPTHLQLHPQQARSRATVPAPAGADPTDVAAAVLTWWSRTSNSPTVWFELSDEAVETVVEALAPLAARPLGCFTLHSADSEVDDTFQSASVAVAEELQTLARRGPYLRDLVGRSPATRHQSIAPSMRLRIGIAGDESAEGSHLFEAAIDPVDSALTVIARSTEPELQRVVEQISALAHAACNARDASLHSLDLLAPNERALLDSWNDTGLAYDRTATIDRQFREQAARTPHAPAVSCADATVTYAELLDAVERFAARLQQAGATHGSLVGVALERDIDLMVALLGILSVGSAYVPLDPGYPEERLAYMVTDSGLQVLVAAADVAERIGGSGLTVLSPAPTDPAVHDAPASGHTSDDIAYVIYTSGSTGRPKGVMLQHGNVVNFFAAMDAVIDHDPPGTWLAVTSLSFDISVLELLWTVTRGFEVVIQQFGITSPGAPSTSTTPTSTAGARRNTRRPTNLSLFFFAAGDAVASDGYRLLRESSQYADQHGFEAVWLPERHFHEFGGAYPNPSVLASAVAVLTSHIHIRAGSVVLPLHPSARVAEEWSVVDNLSQGRVGISFAPGWQPNDFVLNPSGYLTARDNLQSRIDEVRALWRGDRVDMVGHDEAMVSVRTLPRPVQAELPVWLTSAGTTKTFEKAGEMGLNLLTHMLGQSAEQLADNIQVYRNAWRAAGHAGEGRITVMLHTFLCDDTATAKQKAEQPMKRYLGTATGLLKNMASAFPTFANAGASADEAFRSLTDSEMDELLTMAATRYLDTSGLFGNTADALEMAESLSEMGVDELACLIDFGIDTQDVLDSLPLLGALKARLDESASASATAAETEAGPTIEPTDQSVAGLVGRHSVTHLQCTPSLAAMLMAEPGDRAALGAIKHLMVGGEALPEKLGAELREAVSGRFTNMYGPTETTIWSLVHEIEQAPVGPVPIGRPIANTTLHILDPSGRPVPVRALGELHIGGEGVARGYLGRDDLTQQRFVERDQHGRLYATGDLARFGDDGVVEFAGRVDFQVKIRGHRIELGEIEAQLDSHSSVDRSVVVARGDAADARLIAFVVPAHGVEIDEALLRKHVASTLPDVMVPDFVVSIAALPLTPNGKVDRAALPADVRRGGVVASLSEVAAPKDDLERLVADVWTEQLGRPVGRSDNFFDIGGHSLLAVAVFRNLQQVTGLKIALTDVFRYPTVAGFAAYLQQLRTRAEGAGVAGAADADQSADVGSDRGAKRRMMLERRRGGGDNAGKDTAQ